MSKWLASSAALAVVVLLSIPGGVGAAERASAGVMENGGIEVSAAKRHRRSQVRVTVRPRTKRYYAHPHPTDLVTYSRPYFVPGPPKHATGFRRDGIGTGAYGFGYN